MRADVSVPPGSQLGNVLERTITSTIQPSSMPRSSSSAIVRLWTTPSRIVIKVVPS
jgi:hypothetical protein